MRKLALDLEHLAVESFHIEADLPGERGTVRGRIEGAVDPETVDNTDVEVCTYPGVCVAATSNCTPVCSVSCPPFCTHVCTITNAYTCPRSCGYIICIRLD